MTKLDYTLSAEDIALLDRMRLHSDPLLAIIKLDSKKTNGSITKTVSAADLAEGSAFLEFKKLAHDAAEHESAPCIAVFLLDTENKQSKAKKQVMCAVKWVPDTCMGRNKMIYTSAWASIKQELQKSHLSTSNMFEANDWDEVEDKTACL